MIYNRLRHISTEKKIALFFTGAVFFIVSAIEGIVFSTTQQQWKYSKEVYANKVLSSVRTKKDAELLDNVRVFDEKNTAVFNGGIFTSIPSSQIKHNSTVRFDGSSYFISVAETSDGGSVCYAQNVTDFVNTRDSIILNTLGFSLLSIIFIYIIGVYFSRYILGPIRNINDDIERYSLRSEVPVIPWGGDENDDIGILIRTINGLFVKIHRETEKTEQFSSDVSHEFKNKLTELKTHIQIMLAKEMYSENCLTKMNESVNSMNSLIESLILLARLDETTLEMEEMPIKEAIMSCEEAHHAKVAFDGDDTRARIQGPLFCLAIGNIIGNAVKFTPEDGNVDIILRKGILTIQDNGIGIRPENLPRIWDRFYKESQDRKYQSGYGIGLSLAKKIFDVHGFSVEVESVLGKGTKFTIDLAS